MSRIVYTQSHASLNSIYGNTINDLISLSDNVRWHIQLQIGDKVKLSDPANPKAHVGSGRIAGFGGEGLFHNRPIPKKYLRINLESVEVNVPLIVPNEEADQSNLEDALGSSVLWLRDLTFHSNWYGENSVGWIQV